MKRVKITNYSTVIYKFDDTCEVKETTRTTSKRMTNQFYDCTRVYFFDDKHI